MPTPKNASPLSGETADAIAKLLNARNQLAGQYTRERVLKEAKDYIPRSLESGEVIGCVQIKKVQWYQAEILHLTVVEEYARKGHAKALLRQAEIAARDKGARVVQCTIRADNDASRHLFEAFGFVQVNAFINEDTGNTVNVFQKVLD